MAESCPAVALPDIGRLLELWEYWRQRTTYLRIVVEGEVGAGDEIRVVERPAHELTIREVFRIYTRDRAEAERLLAVPRMSESWRRWADKVLQKAKGRPADAAEPGCR